MTDKQIFMIRIEPSTDGIGDPYHEEEESYVLKTNQSDPVDTGKPIHLNLIHYEFLQFELTRMTVKSQFALRQKKKSTY